MRRITTMAVPISIYQINHERDEARVCFLNYYSSIARRGLEIDAGIYDKVFEGEVKAASLEEIYTKFNRQIPDGFTGRSVSVSDVIEVRGPIGKVWGDTDPAFFFVDSVGFKKVSFDKAKAEVKA